MGMTRRAHNFRDLSGQAFGRLTAIEVGEKPASRSYEKRLFWRCRCECGNHAVVCSRDLIEGNTRSCGCLLTEIIHQPKKHGMTRTPTWRTWEAMRQRCLNPKATNYQYYGGRGIRVCDRWLGEQGFENFLADMGESPKGYTIERTNNQGNYTKDNCQWIPKTQQAKNRRALPSERLIAHQGQTMNVRQWSLHLGLSEEAVRQRLRAGWSIERALSPKVP